MIDIHPVLNSIIKRLFNLWCFWKSVSAPIGHYYYVITPMPFEPTAIILNVICCIKTDVNLTFSALFGFPPFSIWTDPFIDIIPSLPLLRPFTHKPNRHKGQRYFTSLGKISVRHMDAERRVGWEDMADRISALCRMLTSANSFSGVWS